MPSLYIWRNSQEKESTNHLSFDFAQKFLPWDKRLGGDREVTLGKDFLPGIMHKNQIFLDLMYAL